MKAAGAKGPAPWTAAATFRRPPSAFCNGFTLIELLVVLVLIGIVVSFATLAIGDDRERLVQDEVRRIAALLETAGEEAVLQGRELGLQISQRGYRFMFLAPQEDGPAQWLVLERDRLLRPRDFHPETAPQLLLEGLPQPLTESFPERGAPQLFLLSSGERTPFVLRLTADNGRIAREIAAGPLAAVQTR